MLLQGIELMKAESKGTVLSMPLERISTGLPLTGVKDLPILSLNSSARLFRLVRPSRL